MGLIPKTLLHLNCWNLRANQRQRIHLLAFQVEHDEAFPSRAPVAFFVEHVVVHLNELDTDEIACTFSPCGEKWHSRWPPTDLSVPMKTSSLEHSEHLRLPQCFWNYSNALSPEQANRKRESPVSFNKKKTEFIWLGNTISEWKIYLITQWLIENKILSTKGTVLEHE